MAVYNVGPQRRALLADTATLHLFPAELLPIIRSESTTSTTSTTTATTATTAPSFLDAIAQAALLPRLTGPLFAHFEPLFADLCARWLLHARRAVPDDQILAAFARVLPLAPYLSVLLDQYLEIAGPPSAGSSPSPLPHLLTLWRLVRFDRPTYAPLVPADLQSFFQDPSPAVRDLAIRLFCLVHEAADAKLEALQHQFLPADDARMADCDGVDVDYTFLSLYEQTRCDRWLARAQAQTKIQTEDDQPEFLPLTPLVAAWGHTVVPRPAPDLGTRASPPPTTSLVHTATTLANLESLARCLQRPEPILLRGLPGAGKTALVHEAARALGMEAGLVTLHLNEQTDAKTLVGLYAAGAQPGSFAWRPGVLTAAVQEGRWVLIEDLDRAPTEVLSTLLPLLERRALLVPARRETVRARASFRLFATVRTSVGLHGQEIVSGRALLGERLWQRLAVRALPAGELAQVVRESFPALAALVPDMLAVYERLTSTSTSTTGMDRPATLRDLLKWCRRVERVLGGAGGAGGLTDTSLLHIFLDAMDCFAGSAKDERARQAVGAQMAQALRLPPAVAAHALDAHEPALQETERQLTVGRASVRKTRTHQKSARARPPFATTAHARRLLEQIAVGVSLREPLLLVGETGIGKTTVVQQLAASVGRRLVVVNLSQQSEAGDLLGGFKPVSARSLAMPLKEEFEDLFAATGISAARNDKYLQRIAKSLARGRWADLCRLWQQAPKMFAQILGQLREGEERKREEEEEEKKGGKNGRTQSEGSRSEGSHPKRRRTESRLAALVDLQPRWDAFGARLEQFSRQVAHGSGAGGAFAFAFVEGKIVQAVRQGDWLLLDEINLASADTLESIADLLSAGVPSLLLSETGSMDRIEAHADFRVFGAMNPATDVGKRDLPLGLRSRFTELYVGSPDRSVRDLVPIVQTYLKNSGPVVERVARLYLAIKALAAQRRLVDGAGEVPHYSLRTLTRVLRYVDDVAACYGLDRALVEGFAMGFLTLLSQQSEALVVPLIREHLAADDRQLARPPQMPRDGRPYVRFTGAGSRQYWLLQGASPPRERSDYIRTPSVERNLLNLVRATSTRRFPVLLQGPTSAGKTSMIEFLADLSGNRFVRINNHEHTDLQEYLGTYRADADGRLRFCEGVLVQAMRQGHWLVLDELNLAPTDVLEALNRLLDDNRELLIPETQEVVRPHERFVLFATQNPAGLYGGRKALSRAFRNRFLELHVDDIPEDELGQILQQRCRNTAPSDCARMVAVYKELSRLRQTTRLFEHKNSFATLRDLFRWALRDADSREDIAAHGVMLLAERVRDRREREAVQAVVERVFKTKVDIERLYSPERCPELGGFLAAPSSVPPTLSSSSAPSSALPSSSSALPSTPPTSSSTSSTPPSSSSVVWTRAMRRLFVLVAHALRNNEPVLLVGETGCGKTTVCQLLADAAGRPLHTVNAHQNTETGDLIGSQRPVRNRSGLLAQLDENLRLALTLASDPALPASTDSELLLQYKALPPSSLALLPPDLVARIAHDDARSRALFEWSDGSLVHAMKTGAFFLLDEISLADDSVLERLNSVLEPQRTLLLAEKGTSDDDQDLSVVAHEHFQFLATMNPGGDFGKKELSPALRNRFTEIWVPALADDTDTDDVTAIVAATLQTPFRRLGPAMVAFAVWFGRVFRATAATPLSIRDLLVWAQFVNRLGHPQDPLPAVVHGAATVFIDGLGANPGGTLEVDANETGRRRCLDKLDELLGQQVAAAVYAQEPRVHATPDTLWAGDFFVGRTPAAALDAAFAFDAPTTRRNAMRLVRAMQLPHKPVLLEGSPGVGKTTLVAALAAACGQPLTRINLSDQTDLMDLFGTDVPVEGAEAGRFAWRDAPFLQAMQRGEWVLLDEMNLASQSVLEGLNACLDHRGQVYVAELDQSFRRHPDFRLFAAQNPHHQGGGRKGLPASFVNRFLLVYADLFSEADQLSIAHRRFPDVSAETVRHITALVAALDRETVVRRSFGLLGAPWEFNLRDTLRWLELAATSSVSNLFDVAIRQRFRSEHDRRQVTRLFAAAFAADHLPHSLYHAVGPATAQAGIARLPRSQTCQPAPTAAFDVRPHLPQLESLLLCVQHNLPCILVGASGTGKSALLRHVAALAGRPLVVFSLSADVDAMDLVGGFEQADPVRAVYAALDDLQSALGAFLLDHAADAPVAASAVAAADLARLLLARDADETAYFSRVADGLARLAPLIEAQSALGAAAARAYDGLRQPLTLAAPRFEWLDSVLVHAAQAGHWLVLDNANLCSASVLDRLNSLLERPHGFLSINEHSGPDGEPRVVALHPDFRVFLTVDPRHGELSRAMRNRSVEIFLDQADQVAPVAAPVAAPRPPVETRMLRFADLLAHADADPALWLDNLSLADAALLPRFFQALTAGGLSSPLDDRLLRPIRARLAFLSSADAAPLRNAILHQYRDFDQIAELPLHPSQNSLAVQSLASTSASASALPTWLWWLGTCYERSALLFAARESLQEQHQQAAARLAKLSLLNRLQRASLAGNVAVVARDSTASAFRFLSETLAEMHACLTASLPLTRRLPDDAGKDARHMLHVVQHIWWRTYAQLTVANNAFDDARFQAHLAHGRALLRQLLPAMQHIHDEALQTQPELAMAAQSFHGFVESMLRRLARDFADGFRLTTGQSMDLLWPLLRPLPIPDEPVFRQVTAMERLAARFDRLKWRISDTGGAASAADLGRAMTALAEAYRLLRVDTTDAAALVQAVADEIASLEARVPLLASDQSLAGPPLFADIFEAVRQLHVLFDVSSDHPGDPDDHLQTLVLSDLPTFAQLRLLGTVGVARQLQTVDYLLAQDAALRLWSGALAAALLRKTDRLAASSALSSLRALEQELPLVGRVVSRASAALAADPVAKLDESLMALLAAVGACFDAASPLPRPFRRLLDEAGAHPQLAAVQITQDGLVIDTVPAVAVFWPALDDQLAAVAHDRWLAPLLPVLQQHFLPALVALAAAQHHRQTGSRHRAQPLSAVAWVQVAVGCLKLYTPDKVFDPFLEWQTEQDFHETLRARLVQDAAALGRFEHDFTGQDGPSLRLSLAHEDVAVLDAAWTSRQARLPNVSEDTIPRNIYRPTNTGAANELSRLQKDVFHPVLDVTVKDDLSAAHYRIVSSLLDPAGTHTATAHQELQLVQSNVVRLIERLLMSQFTAYQDLAVPVANLLRCLQLGLSLSESARAAAPDPAEAPWLGVTPFLGGHRTTLEAVPAPVRRSWDFLLLGGVCASVDGGSDPAAVVTSAFSPEGRRQVAECFHFFFDEWNRKLEADRRAEEAKTNLYRFRGSLEDEEAVDEAEFSELFPTYSGNEEPINTSAKKTLATWDLSADVAKIHRDIFAPSRPATDAILAFCQTIARKTAETTETSDAGKGTSLLPATLLAVDDKLHSLRTATSASTYNFYTDTNLPEARRLVALVHDIQTRFRGLQAVDEIGHLQPLADVVQACEHVLALPFTAPLARVLPPVEKLHETLYEWQFRGYASRQYLTPTLYDRTTTTLVSWRKLELSTWSRLFDMEADKCRQDAGAWWFIAYQAAVAGPMSILVGSTDSNPEALAYHAEQLIKELAAYLSASIVGQYAARLALLRQIAAHIGLLVDDYPAMARIRHAVQSLVQFYAPYEHKAAEAVQKGRAGLQKTMNDVLLLASWRDTNIDALRESARKSHLKLFRLVRKFRAVLGQPMLPIIQQGLPDDSEQEIVRGSQELDDDDGNQNIDLVRPQAAAKVCAQQIPGWGEDAHTRRLAGVDRIVSIMRQATALPTSALDASDVVASFVTDLVAAMAELRKETPGLLTEENKDAVKHLKTRKIRLFDDTLKAVRQMGFSANLGTSRLAAQASLALIFSGSLGPDGMQLPQELDLAGLAYSFHKLLDLAPQFREALHEHHGDLQRVTARRSVGHLEGILFVTLRQRELLTASARSLASLDHHIASIDSLSAGLAVSGDDKEPLVDTSRIQLETHASDYPRTLRWLLAIVHVGMHLVDVHDRLATIDCKPVRTQLAAWASKLEGLRAALDAESPVLPGGFVASSTLELRAQIDKELALFVADLDSLIESRPDLAYVLEQIKLWAVTDGPDHKTCALPATSQPRFAEEALNLSKRVLDAVQKFHKAVAELPTSTEDASWLVDYSTKLSSAAKSLHVGTVVAGIEQCIDLLRADADTLHSPVGTSLLRLLLPLLQQYAATFRRTLLRLATLHRSTCQLGHRLGRAFVEIAAQGFCTPPEKSDESSGQTNGKLEEGTGLGDGEGAEDISKDIQPDEDLSELAQSANKEQQDKGEEVEDEKDAIDMGNDEMEGEMGDAAGEEEDEEGGDDKEGEDEEEEDMDEEAGDVDDLDPTAVDEKMWDGEDAKDTEKEQQGNESKGQKNDDEQVAAADSSESKAADEAAAGEEGGDEEEKKAEEDEKEDGGDDKEEGEDDDAIGSDDEQVGPQQELNRQDQNVDQSDALDLPDDMELDEEGDEGEEEDEEFDDLKDLEGKEEAGEDTEMEEKRGKTDDGDVEEEEETGLEGDVEGEKTEENEEEEKEDEDADGMDVDEDVDNVEDVEDVEDEKVDDESAAQPPVSETQAADKDTAAPNDVQSGVGPDQQEEQSAAQNEQADKNENNSSAKRDEGEMGQETDEKDTMAGGDNGVLSNRERNDEAAEPETSAEAEQQQQQQQPFKKLGDVLERWHRNQREIRPADEEPPRHEENSADQAAEKEFQHLHDEEAPASTQAMGAAEDDEARPFDDSMAIEEEGERGEKGEEGEKSDSRQHANDESNEEDDKMQEDVDVEEDKDNAQKTEGEDGRAGASLQRGAYEEEDDRKEEMKEKEEEEEEEDQDQDEEEAKDEELLAAQLLSSTHLEDESGLMPMDEALRLWTDFQTATHGLSLALAAQLRLILTPSQATRLSGGFRTGKRLSIRKIIPYIASGYKRDKIWMRRSVPTKRAYQILLCVDDSKSMGAAGVPGVGVGSGTGSGPGHSGPGFAGPGAGPGSGPRPGPGHLALTSLVMVARALAMLEAGQVGVLGFGARVFAAHGLLDAEPFGGAAGSVQGAAALRRFTFQQDRTDVAQLLRTTMDTFQQARAAAAQTGGGSSADLWQLAILLSDGLTPSAAHERIRQLLREAAESRIMVVFVVLDEHSTSESVLDLKEAKFVRDPATGTSRVVIERYLDTFPFPYYLIVHDLADLPSALAGLLRTWFAEVNS